VKGRVQDINPSPFGRSRKVHPELVVVVTDRYFGAAPKGVAFRNCWASQASLRLCVTAAWTTCRELNSIEMAGRDSMFCLFHQTCEWLEQTSTVLHNLECCCQYTTVHILAEIGIGGTEMVIVASTRVMALSKKRSFYSEIQEATALLGMISLGLSS